MVRFYYRHRLFMGFCCVCCELLYLALFLLHFPQYHAWPLLPLRVPGLTEAHPDGGWLRLHTEHSAWREAFNITRTRITGLSALSVPTAGSGRMVEGMSLALLVALLAVPGWALKQFINCVQLRSAMQLLVATDREQDSRGKRATQEALSCLAKMQ